MLLKGISEWSGGKEGAEEKKKCVWEHFSSTANSSSASTSASTSTASATAGD